MVLRMIFLVIGVVLGMALAWGATDGQTAPLLMGAGIGAVVSVIILAVEQRLKAVPFPFVLCGGGGLVVGLLVAGLIASVTGFGARSPYSVFNILTSLVFFLGIPYWGCLLYTSPSPRDGLL